MRKKKLFLITFAIMMAVFAIPIIAMAMYIDTSREMWMYGTMAGLIIVSAEISVLMWLYVSD